MQDAPKAVRANGSSKVMLVRVCEFTRTIATPSAMCIGRLELDLFDGNSTRVPRQMGCRGHRQGWLQWETSKKQDTPISLTSGLQNTLPVEVSSSLRKVKDSR
jgi:hypothetical protein